MFRFDYGTITRYGRTFQNVLLTIQVLRRGPTTPYMHCYTCGLGSSPVARHYWGNHCLFSLPAGTKMFQFPAFAHSMVCRASSPAGCPIRIPADQRLFAPPRGFSQLITSFVASESQGIRHAPFVTFLRSTASLPHSVFRSLFLYSFQYVKDPFSWRISGSNR